MKNLHAVLVFRISFLLIHPPILVDARTLIVGDTNYITFFISRRFCLSSRVLVAPETLCGRAHVPPSSCSNKILALYKEFLDRLNYSYALKDDPVKYVNILRICLSVIQHMRAL
jgi:hypothetical protein